MKRYEIRRVAQYVVIRIDGAPPKVTRERLKAAGMKYYKETNEWVGVMKDKTALEIMRDAEARKARYHPESKTLCWRCSRAAAGTCSWMSGSGVPVEGWEAKERLMKMDHAETAKTYEVISCPLFCGEASKPRSAYAMYSHRLAVAVIRQAVVDWDSVKRGETVPGESMESIEKFFKSRWCGALLVGTEIEQDMLCAALGV